MHDHILTINSTQMKVLESVQMEIPESAIPMLVKIAYNLSKPVGMGMLHYTPGPLDDKLVDEFIAQLHQTGHLCMDYVFGRQVKFTVRKANNRYFIRRSWQDHTQEQLKQLLESAGLQQP